MVGKGKRVRNPRKRSRGYEFVKTGMKGVKQKAPFGKWQFTPDIA